MAQTKFYFIRHGQSEGNLKNIFLGHTDLDLTDLGREQAALVSDFFDSVPVDVIYASDLKRAYNTGLPTARKKGLSIIPTKEFREIYAGIWEGVLFSSLLEDHKESFGIWRNHFCACRCPEGESVRELWDRVVACVHKIAEENEGKTVLVFTHATPIRLLATYFSGKGVEDSGETPWPSNASVTSARYENGVFTMEEFSRDDFMGEKTSHFTKGTV